MLDAWISEGFEANYANLYEACKHVMSWFQDYNRC